MAQDLRELFKKEREGKGPRMKPGHEKRFLQRMEKKLPRRRKSVSTLWKIAASILIMVSVGTYYLIDEKDEKLPKTTVVKKNQDAKTAEGISLGDLSPDLKKVENYYVANINLELSKLHVSKENKVLVDSFMEQLAELNREYKKLSAELNKIGPNDQTISAMIKNLQLRLQLMHKLKEKLNQLKSSKNEAVTTTNV